MKSVSHSKCLFNIADGFFTDNLVFNLCGLATSILLLDLARNWPKLMKEWVSVEKSMISYGWPLDLDVRLKGMTIVFMSIAAGTFFNLNMLSMFNPFYFSVEHTLVQTSKLIFAFHCTSTPQRAFEFFFVKNGTDVFSFVTYALWKGILLQVLLMY